MKKPNLTEIVAYAKDRGFICNGKLDPDEIVELSAVFGLELRNTYGRLKLYSLIFSEMISEIDEPHEVVKYSIVDALLNSIVWLARNEAAEDAVKFAKVRMGINTRQAELLSDFINSPYDLRSLKRLDQAACASDQSASSDQGQLP